MDPERWTAPSKAMASAGKVIPIVFWDVRAIILIDYLQNGKTIYGEYYANLLERLTDEFKKKRPYFAKKKVLFHEDNAPALRWPKSTNWNSNCCPIHHTRQIRPPVTIIFTQTSQNGSEAKDF